MFSMTAVYTLVAFLLVPLVYFLTVVYTWTANRMRIKARVDQIPGPERERFFGNLRKMPRDGEKRIEWLLENTARFQTYFSIQFGPVATALSVCHPDPIKHILKSGPPKQTSDGSGYSLLLPWLGKGLLVNNGDGWFRNRRLLTPAFHFDVLKPYIKIYNESADVFLDKIQQRLYTTEFSNGAMDIYRDVSLCTLNVMMRCAFSYNADIQRQGENNKYVKAVEDLTHLIMHRFFNPLLYLDALYYLTKNGKQFDKGCKYAHQIAYELINKRRAELATGDTVESIKCKRAIDFLDILLLARDDNGHGLTDNEIRCEVDTFLFEGHDTTASAISWCIYNFASHPKYQLKAREEIDRLLNERETNHITWDDLGKLPYLTTCIKESMRHTPPVPMFMRELDQPVELDGHKLLPGTSIGISVNNLHHNPAVWGDDHMEYKPDRFMHENIKKMDSHAYLPFSAGSRNCIGQNFAMNEIKCVIARVLHRFVLDVDPDKPPKKNPLLVMRSDTGIHIKFTQR